MLCRLDPKIDLGGLEMKTRLTGLAGVVCLAPLLFSCSSTSTSVGELNYAIMNDDLRAVNAGIENGADVNGTNNKFNSTPMHTAAGEGNITILRTLVEAGGEISTPDCAGRTPLMYAAKSGSVAVSRYLVEKGANVNRLAKDSSVTCEVLHPDSSALTVAAAFNKPEVVRFLIDNGAKAGGKRALAQALANPSGEPVVAILKTAGFSADEETARMVAEISQSRNSSQGQDTRTASAQKKSGDDGVGELAADAVAVGVIWSLLGGF